MGPLPGLLMLLFLSVFHPKQDAQLIGNGMHPAIATDPAGGVHVVYGKGNTMFYSTSRDGENFSAPIRVDSLPGLHLGASRGPQIAATAQSVVITAIDKPGNVWSYRLDRATGHWQPKVRVTDIPEVAKEGFVALTAGESTVFNAVWLDLRGNKQNKIVGARSADGGRSWSKNQVLYESPDGTVCECCQLSIVSWKREMAIMFRNFLNGYRDMYLLKSTDGGQTFGKAEKMGKGTWKLSACPMDGGGVSIAPSGTVSTVWRRSDKLFTAQPGKDEQEIGSGKNAKIVATAKGDYVVFQQNGQVFALLPGSHQPKLISDGAYPKLAVLPNDKVLCFWERNGTVRAQLIQ